VDWAMAAAASRTTVRVTRMDFINTVNKGVVDHGPTLNRAVSGPAKRMISPGSRIR